MPFDTSVISEVSYAFFGASVKLTWASTSAGPFQIYVEGVLQWHGVAFTATIPRPPDDAWVDIGAVGPGEDVTDFSASLPHRPRNRAELTWTGGSFEALDLMGFRIYGETTAGGGIDYTTPLADIQAFAEGFAPADMSSSTFTWTSDPYKTGSWSFEIKPYDVVGNEGDGSTLTVNLVSAPAEVPLVNGSRLTRSYTQSTKKLTIGWTASQG